MNAILFLLASLKREGSWSGLCILGSGDLIAKLHRSNWMSDVLPSAFSEMLLASEAGPGPKNQKVNLLCGKFSRAVATCLCLACSKV